MGLFDVLFGGASSADYSDGVTCPVCGAKCAWEDSDDITGFTGWRCSSCSYEVLGDQVEHDSNTNLLNTLGIDWYCDDCNAHLNDQIGFDQYADCWTCTGCGFQNNITKDNVL